jgi:hypothetical protein
MFDFDLHKIFVEGKTDQGFIQFVIENQFGYILNENQVNDFIIDCKGWTNIKDKTSILLDPLRIENGGKNLIIFDSDGKSNDGGFDKRKKQLEDMATRLGINFEIFLFPDNNSDGDLETFYSSCFKEDKAFFKGCWDNMHICFEKNNDKKLDLKIPKSAEMIFSYVDLFEKYKEEVYENKKAKRNYFDKGLWKFDFENNENLKKIVEFLQKYITKNE